MYTSSILAQTILKFSANGSEKVMQDRSLKAKAEHDKACLELEILKIKLGIKGK